jgi:uncharacterized protein involved in exopolysaccharide biosynthesis
MPDLLLIVEKRWKMILAILSLATIIALICVLFSPKKYLAVATALPANSLIADKARVFNSNIEALYSDFGSPDELDKIEGTATLDTIFIAASKEFQLPTHYSINSLREGIYKAAIKLKRNTRINRSSYGELKVKVWDNDRNDAAHLANFLMKQLQELHQHLQNQNNVLLLEKLQEEYALKQKEYQQLSDSLGNDAAASANFISGKKGMVRIKMTALSEQLQQYEKTIGEYQLAVRSNSPVLLIVENARPPLLSDKPKVLQTLLFTFFGALLFSYLLALLVEGRKSSN